MNFFDFKFRIDIIYVYFNLMFCNENVIICILMGFFLFKFGENDMIVFCERMFYFYCYNIIYIL